MRNEALDAVRPGALAGGAVVRPISRPAPVVALSCALELVIPGAGYLVLGKPGRAAVAFFGIAALFLWGYHLQGLLARPEPGEILSYLATFACWGSGAAYWVVAGSEALRRGLGDVTAGSYEYGSTFYIAAGLLGYLLVLDVYDVAVGRKD